MRSVLVFGFACLIVLLPPDVPVSGRAAEKPTGAEELCEAFREYSGARLVFEAGDLPAGQYHDSMPSLDAEGRLKAARVAVAEIKKLPARYLGGIGLEAVGVFRACVSQTGDGFRPYDETLKGYRYFGIWNGKNGAACACYSPEQLALTLHHEIFHHVDATRQGQTRGSRLRED